MDEIQSNSMLQMKTWLKGVVTLGVNVQATVYVYDK